MSWPLAPTRLDPSRADIASAKERYCWIQKHSDPPPVSLGNSSGYRLPTLAGSGLATLSKSEIRVEIANRDKMPLHVMFGPPYILARLPPNPESRNRLGDPNSY